MTRRRRHGGLLSLAALGVAALTGLAAPADSAPLAAMPHITLDRSTPADGEATGGPVSEIRLFFSGAPLMRGASVRVVTSSRSLMRSSPPAADETDPKQVYVRVDPPLPAGTYVVQWRCIADDGHVMRGDFRFEVTAE